MFFKSASSLTAFNMDELLTPYFYLDPALVNGDDDGKACAKKFSNNSQGVAASIRIRLNALATAIIDGDCEVSDNTERLKLMDLFTLYSNHLDQDRSSSPDKPSEQDKQIQVLHWLRAAFKLSSVYDYEQLSQYSARELSSHELMLHYYAKALRYVNVPVAERLVLLENALKIAQYLSTIACSQADDPHAFKGRIATRELVVGYCLQDLHRYDDAAGLLLPQLHQSNQFHRIQAFVQLTNIYVKKFQHSQDRSALDQAFAYGRSAVEESAKDSNTLLPYNARVALMQVYQVAGDVETSNQMAQSILDEMTGNPSCGAKPHHQAAAAKVLEDNHSQTLSTGFSA